MSSVIEIANNKSMDVDTNGFEIRQRIKPGKVIISNPWIEMKYRYERVQKYGRNNKYAIL